MIHDHIRGANWEEIITRPTLAERQFGTVPLHVGTIHERKVDHKFFHGFVGGGVDDGGIVRGGSGRLVVVAIVSYREMESDDKGGKKGEIIAAWR